MTVIALRQTKAPRGAPEVSPSPNCDHPPGKEFTKFHLDKLKQLLGNPQNDIPSEIALPEVCASAQTQARDDPSAKPSHSLSITE